MSELLEASRTILRLWDNPQDLGLEVYTPAHERLREAVEAEERKQAETSQEDEEYAHYVYMGGDMARGQWEHTRKLHLQYIESDRLSPYEEQLKL